MKILSIGTDKNIVDKNSSVSKRAIEYGNLVDKYHVLIVGDKDIKIDLSDNVEVFSVRTEGKFKGFFDLKKRAIKLIKQNTYNLITVQDVYFLSLLALKLAKQFNLGLEIQVHGFEKLKGIRKLIAKYVLKRADSVRTVSQRLKKQLIEDFKVQEDKITVVPIYVEARSTNYELRSTKKGDKFIFLTVGRLVPVKNIQMQIKAIANLKDSPRIRFGEAGRFKNIELWIIGDGPERKDYELRITHLRQGSGRQTDYELKENIKLLGYKKDLAQFYQQADCFLLTSNYEGWEMVVIEAASYGLPIIMTDVGCAGEFIKDGENGIIVPVQDQEVLEKKMEELIKNQELRLKLGNNAQESVKNLLSKEETLNLYKESWERTIN